jgi:pimeloyl-ACP methyl ester carboxylesterase
MVTLPGVYTGPSGISAPSSRAVHLPPELALGPGEAFIIHTEFAHIHAAADGSLHATLPSDVAARAVELCWAELHPAVLTGARPRRWSCSTAPAIPTTRGLHERTANAFHTDPYLFGSAPSPSIGIDMSTRQTRDTKFGVIDRPSGTVAYEITGDGPLILCVPGMGELRSSYRFLAPILVGAGYRVALTDLRGHGDSSAMFDEYGDEATAGDVTALIEKLGEPAIIIGNSLAAGSAVLVAAARPDLVAGLVLVGPFVRPATVSVLQRLVFRVMMAPLWARFSWNAYLPTLYAGRKPADFAEYRKAVSAALKKPGHAKAFSLTTRTSHDAAAAALTSVTAPTLVVMGEGDPDFPDPAAEAQWIADQLNATILMVPESGHYPQAQRPDLVARAVEAFASGVRPHA